MAVRASGTAANEIAALPPVSTRSYPPLPDGRVRGIDNSLWAYRTVPMSALRDARTDEEKVRLGARLHRAFQEISALTSSRAPNRQVAKAGYRRFHLQALNVPTWFEAPRDLATAAQLDAFFRDRLVPKRQVMLGVQLRPNSGIRSWRTFLDDAAEALSADGAPLADFDEDFHRVQQAFNRAELDTPSPVDLRFANTWWNWSMARYTSAATPYYTETDHLHFLRSPEARYAVETFGEGRECRDWPPELRDNPGQVAVTFGAIESFALDFADALDPRTHWAVQLFAHDARVISLHGLVEPPKITQAELRRQRKRFSEDAQEFSRIGKQTRFEMQQQESTLEQLEEAYAVGTVPATLVDISAIVGFDGVVDDISAVSPLGVAIDPLTNRQAAAWHETMLCSSVRSSPHRLELPATTVSYAGLSALSRVGDARGALAGFTELDGQPVWVSGAPQEIGDNLPLMGVFAGPGSGKLLTLDTRLPTPDGGSIAVGEVAVGVQLLDRYGLPCTVTALSPIDPSPTLYRLTLSDRQQIDACTDHQWIVQLPHDAARGYHHLDRVARLMRQLATGWPARLAIGPGTIVELLDHALRGRHPWPTAGRLAATASLLDLDWSVPGATTLLQLAARADRLADEQRLLDVDEAVLTTGELLAFDDSIAAAIRPVLPTDQATARLTALLFELPSDGTVIAAGDRAAEVAAAARLAGRVAVVRDDGGVELAPAGATLRIVSIEPIDTRPGRCLTVDSADASYLCADAVPTHNTQLLQWLAWQWDRLGHAQLIFDPKTGSDLGPVVRTMGGRISSLDELEGSDGLLDPIRFSTSPSVGIQLAGDMLMRVSPWGAGVGYSFETDIANALKHGVRVRGATSTGAALRAAVADGVLDDSIADPIFRMANSYPLFRATIGFGQSEAGLDLGRGATLFKVGDGQFEMPPQGDPTPAEQASSGLVRVSANVVRMLMRAAMSALANRNGIVHFDEAWVLERLARGETEVLGRLGRQLAVLPVLYNQTPSTATDANLQNYMARGFLGYLASSTEGAEGVKLIRAEGNAEVRDRLSIPRGDAGVQGGSNAASLQHLFAPGGHREVARGSVFYHSDLHGRIGSVEIVLPAAFLALSSTNIVDTRRRRH